ncbi:TetR/AcrR family transcriptional regulator [Actinoplanes teichomyceticus]|uniref:TetR family transcriptional regulator n=1 Tax=Actinoplanes teichomyceticus TaxID=1867 RepID=A0A561WJZ9_ACTTI|nr:TetR family transcriptional regulator C-terminal domain-containing protein [Actinoplanes teichomyceticus]TWG24168.1 TetR family transcriptional regulator [Actinoplanes teichomyceticus]GIF12987.1 TetR family transcriptional regulator [Actinoplanes teichomyceticus]
MPKIVDHDQRRSEIVEAFLTVVARAGLAAATSRAIAAELGIGTGALWHYFDGFDEVAAGAYRRITERTNDRIAVATAGLRGLDAVYAMLREILPLTKETLDEAHVVVGFWGRLAANATIEEKQTDLGEYWGGLLRRHFAEAVADGELDPSIPVADVLDVLFAICIGQQVNAVMASPMVDPGRQLAMIDHCLRPWRR